ncbi:MAG: hypothetical protein ACE15C_15885 [Phycisphaerae bacterium]
MPDVANMIRSQGLARAIEQTRVAGLILTYRCTAACEHCLFCCGPRAPAAAMTVDQAVEAIVQLHETGRAVHVAGGEAMIHWEVLLAAVQRTAILGKPPHFIETNASWAVSDELVRDRLGLLKAAGVLGVLISSDPFHQKFVPAERFIRARRIAWELFGRANVLASSRSDQEIIELERTARDPDALAAYVRAHTPRLVGRAASLARFVPPRKVEDLAGDALWHSAGRMDCRDEFDPRTMWEIHVDPYCNIQTCCGVLLGHLRSGTVAEQASGGWRANPVVDLLSRQGPLGLAELAAKHGYRLRETYPQKCYLCYELRRVLQRHYPQWLGPAEVYATPTAL